jgi:hypothetical protein
MAMVVERTNVWQDFAACAGRTDLFFPDKSDDIGIAQARHICLTECKVREACWEYAVLTHQKDGVWGGVFLEVGTSQRKRLCCPGCESADLGGYDGTLECYECGHKWAG